MRRLKVGDKPDKINICPVCSRKLPEEPKINELMTCMDGTWRYNGKEWEVVLVSDDDWNAINVDESV